MISVLFVCHGNICRSPMGEFVLKDMVAKHLLIARHNGDAALERTLNDTIGSLGIIYNLDNKVYLRIVKYSVGIVGKLGIDTTLLIDIAHADTADMYTVRLYASKYIVEASTYVAKAKKSYV